MLQSIIGSCCTSVLQGTEFLRQLYRVWERFSHQVRVFRPKSIFQCFNLCSIFQAYQILWFSHWPAVDFLDAPDFLCGPYISIHHFKIFFPRIVDVI